jgi:hypothetical protein
MSYLRRSMTGIAYWRFSCRSPHRVPTNLQRQSSHSSNPFDKAESELVQGTPFKKPSYSVDGSVHGPWTRRFSPWGRRWI